MNQDGPLDRDNPTPGVPRLIPVCITRKQPVRMVERLAEGLGPEIAVFEGQVGEHGSGDRVLFAAQKRQMALLEPSNPEEPHPHVGLGPNQILFKYNAN